MTKKARILELLAKGHSTREVAGIIGCRPEYVRAARARATGRTSADVASDHRKLVRYQTDPEYRSRYRAYQNDWRRARTASQEART